MDKDTESNFISRPCRFMLDSISQDDTLCNYMLDEVTQYSNTDNVVKCQFYLKGICRFGSNCLFSHTTPNSDGHLTLISDKQTAIQLCQQEESQSTNSLLTMDANKLNVYQPNFNALSQSCTNMMPTFGADYSNKASEFVPKTTRSSVHTVKSNVSQIKDESLKQNTNTCSQFYNYECPNKEDYQCVYAEFCELCGKYCMSSIDEAQKTIHIEFRERKFEPNMKLSHSLHRCLNKVCTLCMDLITEKNLLSENLLTESPFAILENCNHVFHISCIRKLRKHRQRNRPCACPECGVTSNFYVTSQYFVEAEEKAKLISNYKVRMSRIPCNHFREGRGSCRFGKECLYLHANPDDTKAKLPYLLREDKNPPQ